MKLGAGSPGVRKVVASMCSGVGIRISASFSLCTETSTCHIPTFNIFFGQRFGECERQPDLHGLKTGGVCPVTAELTQAAEECLFFDLRKFSLTVAAMVRSPPSLSGSEKEGSSQAVANSVLEAPRKKRAPAAERVSFLSHSRHLNPPGAQSRVLGRPASSCW